MQTLEDTRSGLDLIDMLNEIDEDFEYELARDRRGED